MIKSNNGKVEVRGRRKDLIYELSLIMKSFLNDGVCDHDDILKCLIFAEMSDEELDEINNEQNEFINSVIEEIDKMDNIGDALNMLGALKALMS